MSAGPNFYADLFADSPDSHQFDRHVLDSGDVLWQPWMVGRDWEPEDAHLPWVPLALAASIGGPR